MTIDLAALRSIAERCLTSDPPMLIANPEHVLQLVAVVEAALAYMQNKSTQFSDIENKLRALTASLQPFTNGVGNE